MALPDQLSLLCRAIQEKGQREAKKIRARTQKLAEGLLHSAEEQVRRELEQHLSEKRQSAFQQARQVKDGANLQASRLLLQTKEAILLELFLESRQTLEKMAEEPHYPEMLRALVLQAMAELSRKECLVQVRQADQPLFSEQFCRDLAQESGCRVELMARPAEISGGCLVYSHDQRVLVDFSFSTLLIRAEPRLRDLLAADLLMGEEP